MMVLLLLVAERYTHEVVDVLVWMRGRKEKKEQKSGKWRPRGTKCS